MMVEPPGTAASTTHATPKDRPIKSRSRRFTLPAHDDARVGRVVEGLLSDHRPTDHPERGQKTRATSGDPLRRSSRGSTGRLRSSAKSSAAPATTDPSASSVVDLSHGRDLRAVRLAATILRCEARDTDHVTRVGQGRFQILSPDA